MEKYRVLNGNHLKLIAAAAMLLDHMGILLFPKLTILRILGRLAYPIYAYMIAEGCRYTRSKLRYFLLVFGLGAACQLVYYFASGDTYLNILLTFSLSIALICLPEGKPLPLLAAVAAVVALNKFLVFDYGIWGIVTPVLAASTVQKRWHHWVLFGLGLAMTALSLGGIQWWSLLALPLLMLYNGRRGKYKMKYFFYIFYPAHLAILQVIAWLV